MELAHDVLDAALDQPTLIPFVPSLQVAVQIDTRGVERLRQALHSDQVPIWMYQNLAFGRTTDQLAGGDLKDLILLIADKTEGLAVALNILSMRLSSDRSAHRQHEPELLDAGRELLRRIRFIKSNPCGDHELAAVVRTCLTEPEAAPLASEVAGRLRRAVAASDTYAFDNDNLLKALLSVQPKAVLDAIFEADDNEDRADIAMFDHLQNYRSNPADEISCEELISWCNQSRETRYPLAASFVTFARRNDERGPQVWSEHARALLAHAPDPERVLAEFIERFRPMSWSGSRAALIEANARLLDSLETDVSARLTTILTDARAQLARDVVREREWETAEDRARDERFE